MKIVLSIEFSIRLKPTYVPVVFLSAYAFVPAHEDRYRAMLAPVYSLYLPAYIGKHILYTHIDTYRSNQVQLEIK